MNRNEMKRKHLLIQLHSIKVEMFNFIGAIGTGQKASDQFNRLCLLLVLFGASNVKPSSKFGFLERKTF